MRKRINSFLKINHIIKKNKTFDIVGCTPEFLKEYLEQKFTEGMSWELVGQHIHIDHIIPYPQQNLKKRFIHYVITQIFNHYGRKIIYEKVIR